ncbi:uncharacterized protein [Rutidosis leptorrhynchoides]|uniref:uncharacterized protein n=1 Tax=Rutidosis leptorrhynchoides TaxID=125765 RepID=UPI003A993A8C
MAHYIPKNYDVQTAPIRRRLFKGFKDSQNVLISDVEKMLLKSDHRCISDDDVVRLAIILIVERGFMGKQGIHVVNKKFLWLVEELSRVNQYPWGSRIWEPTYEAVSEGFVIRESQLESGKAYTLAGFMWAFKIWILESYRRTIKPFAKKTDKNGVPRALFWKRSSAESFGMSEYLKLLHIQDECPKKKRPFRGLQPTETEQSCQWWIQSDVYFRGGKVPEDEIEVEVQDDEVDTDDPVVDGSEQTHHKHSIEDVHTEGLHDYDDMCFNRSLSDNETERPSPMHIRCGIRERKPTGVLRSPFTTPGYRKPIEKLSKDVIEKVESMNAVKLGTEEDQGQQQINEDVVPMDTDAAAEVSVDKQPVKVTKRKRKEQDWATEEEIWGMIDRFINDQGTLQPPPPNAWRDGRKHAGPAKDPKTMIESKQETRCMFIFQNEQFIFINQEFWLRLLHIDGWATFLLRYRQRFLPRASQVYATPEFPAEKEVGTQEESTTDGEGIIGQNPPDYMYLIGLGDSSVNLYPSWADCDQVLIPIHFYDEEHFLLLQLKLEEMKAIDYFNKTQDSQIVGYYENKESVELMIEPGPVVPIQTGGHGDCGVWVCIHMERIIYGREEVDNIGDAKKAAEQYRNKMARTFFHARFDTQEPPPPTPPVEIQVD